MESNGTSEEDLRRRWPPATGKPLRPCTCCTRWRVFGLIYYLVGHRQDAEDLLQDVMAQVWRKASRYDPTRPFWPWLAAVSTNYVRAAARRRQLSLQPLPNEQHLPVEEANPIVDELIRRLDRDRVQQAIQQLPNDQRLWSSAATWRASVGKRPPPSSPFQSGPCGADSMPRGESWRRSSVAPNTDNEPHIPAGTAGVSRFPIQRIGVNRT